MSQKRGGEEAQKESSQKEISWEEAVSRYLEDQPDFFLRHADLLQRLTIKHDTGGAVSLIEHQVHVLRSRNQELAEQLRDLVDVARENDALGTRLHHFALAMIGANSADEVISTACDLLRQEFRLDAVSVRIKRESAPARSEYVSKDDRRLNELMSHFDGAKPQLDAAHDESLRAYLFGEQGAQVRSCALIPLGGTAHEGVLALGSYESSRFHPGMGTVYLSRIGELLWRALTSVPE